MLTNSPEGHLAQHDANVADPHMNVTERARSAMHGGEIVRARTYALLANLLYATPSPDILQTLRSISIREPKQEHPVAMAWEALRLTAGAASPAALDDEYHDLFIGLGRGEVVPYASWYLTGFLMEKPLAALRQTLTALGVERQAHVHEPEDHAAALCEVMEVLIVNADEFGLNRQCDFFMRYVRPWMGRFFEDLQQAKSARFYRAVGQLGERFIDFEQEYLLMADDGSEAGG